MSTQIADDEHIRVLVWAGLRPHPDGPLTWYVDRPNGRQGYQVLEENAARVGAMLHDQNVAAYEERYGEDEDEDDDEFEGLARSYVHAAPRHTGWTPIDLFKAIEFYVYQSFHDEDHDEAPTVEALQFCGALVRRLGPDLPEWGDPSFPAALTGTAEWNASPWGITSATVS
jgi:hypothetical protein